MPPPDASRTLLLVDDDATFRNRLARAFTERGFEVLTAPDGEKALLVAQTESPELALVDLKMPGMSGLELVGALKRIDATTNIMVLTGYGSIATALEAVRLGATHYLTKPVDIEDILAAFERSAGGAVAPAPLKHEVPSLARAEWEHIQRVLTDSGGNISQAARLRT